jgi:hypothetical protein
LLTRRHQPFWVLLWMLWGGVHLQAHLGVGRIRIRFWMAASQGRSQPRRTLHPGASNGRAHPSLASHPNPPPPPAEEKACAPTGLLCLGGVTGTMVVSL